MLHTVKYLLTFRVFSPMIDEQLCVLWHNNVHAEPIHDSGDFLLNPFVHDWSGLYRSPRKKKQIYTRDADYRSFRSKLLTIFVAQSNRCE